MTILVPARSGVPSVADPAAANPEAALPRRAFLRGLGVLSLTTAPVAAVARDSVPAVKAVPLEDYVAFLAHEHRAALVELYRPANPLHIPICWFPESPAVEARIAAEAPSLRAARIFATLDLVGGAP